MRLLENKHILLILPKFFGYDRVIASRLEQEGAVVSVVYEDMDEVNYCYRFINAYLPKYMPLVMNRYFLKCALPIAKNLDYVLLIRGEFLNPEVLEILKNHTPARCVFCMYQWDSTKNNKNALRINKYFDYISTFDPVDAKAYGWIYRPLFYIPELVNKRHEDIDVLCICSLHSKRIQVLNRLKKICNEKELVLYRRVYSKKLIFYKRKYIDRRDGYTSADNKDVSSAKMDVSDTYDLYNRSGIIVDYTHPGQNGFTMRTIEALGCGKKFVTNNKQILDADFYNPNNMFIYDGEDIEIPNDFIRKPYQEPEKALYKKYSIDSWLASILNLKEL